MIYGGLLTKYENEVFPLGIKLNTEKLHIHTVYINELFFAFVMLQICMAWTGFSCTEVTNDSTLCTVSRPFPDQLLTGTIVWKLVGVVQYEDTLFWKWYKQIIEDRELKLKSSPCTGLDKIRPQSIQRMKKPAGKNGRIFYLVVFQSEIWNVTSSDITHKWVCKENFYARQKGQNSMPFLLNIIKIQEWSLKKKSLHKKFTDRMFELLRNRTILDVDSRGVSNTMALYTNLTLRLQTCTLCSPISKWVDHKAEFDLGAPL